MMRGMTQEQFAAELGIPKYSIRAYEQGRRFPKYETLDSICETLGISPEYLYCLGIMNANEFVHTLFSLELGNAIRENEPYHGLHFFLIAESWQDETK